MKFGDTDYEERLEKAIDRQLKVLPELSAPRTLALRVRVAIEAQTLSRRNRRSWENWPIHWQVLSLVFGLALFAGLCFVAWQLPHTTGYDATRHQVHGWTVAANTVWNTLTILLNALAAAIQKLGTGLIVGALAAVGLAYGVCVALGTVCVRLAWARPGK